MAGIDGPGHDGLLTVRFTQPLPGWRRLWSGPDSVGAPRPGVWGGPFVLAGSTPGLEVVLRRNDRWYGGPGPFLDEVRLVLVPDSTTARQLLERGELDVLMPPAGTNRTAQLRARPGLSIETAAPGGWWVGLHLNDDRMDGDDRRGLVATVDRARFVRVLLQGEAAPLTGFGGPRDTTWPATLGAGDAGPLDGDVDVVGFREEPMTYLLQRAMQKRARDAGARLELRNAEADRVEGWLLRGEYGAGVVVAYDAPDLCWRCRWATVDDNLARAADAGDANAVLELERKLRDEALLLPLWRPVTVVAWRGPVRGVRANGWALSAAWNAAEWWLEP